MTNPQKPKKKEEPDWDKVWADYSAGVKSNRQISREYGIPESSIRKKAKELGIEKSLAGEIQKKADKLVFAQSVRGKVAENEEEIVEANAQVVANVRIAHRRDISRSRLIAMSLLEELEQQTGAENVALLTELGDLMRSEDDKGQDKLNDLYHKIISLPGRAKTMKDLGESLRVLIAMERQAYGMDKDNGPANDPLTSLLNGIAKSNSSAFLPVSKDPDISGN